MKIIKSFIVAFFVLFSLSKAEAQNFPESESYIWQEGKKDFPPQIRRIPNGKEGDKQLFHEIDELPELTDQQEVALYKRLGSMPDIAPYVYSGCHDRAHAVWQQLDAKQKELVSKVWVMAPGMTTLAFSDFLTLPALGKESPTWGYHVALAYKVGGNIRVIDAVQPDWQQKSVSIEQWLDGMSKPYGSFMTFLPPELYLFYGVIDNETTAGLVSNNNKTQVATNGQFFECVGPCRSFYYIEASLARDEVATDLIQGKGCDELKDVATKPADLLTMLNGEPLDSCLPAFNKFQSRKDYWEKQLWPE